MQNALLVRIIWGCCSFMAMLTKMTYLHMKKERKKGINTKQQINAFLFFTYEDRRTSQMLHG